MPTQINFTIKKDGSGDYTSIKSFVLANQKDLVAADESQFVTIYGAGWNEITPLSESFIDFNNYTTDSTRNITFYVRVEDRHNFTAGTGFVFTVPTSFGFVLRSKYVLFDGFEISNTSNTNNLFDTSTNAKLTNCIVHDVDYAQFSGDGENNIHYNYASRGGFTNTFYNGGTLKNITCVQLLTEGGFTGDIGIANANCTNVVLYTDKPTGSFTNFFNCTGDYNAVNKSGEGVPGANSFDTVLTTDFVDFTNDNYISKLGGQLESSGEGGTFIGAALESGAIGGVTGDILFDVDAIEFSGSGSATLPQPSGDINFDLAAVEFSGTASATLPQPSGDILFDLPAVEFSATGSATLPQPSGNINFDIPSIEFSGSGSATVPFPVGNISFDIPSIEFSGTGSATQPNPIGDIAFDVAPIEFSGAGSASLPFPVGNISFDIAPIEFSGTGSATFPQPSGDVAFDVPAIEFSGTGGATQPDPVGNISFDIPAIEFSATGSVTGVTLPPGEIIIPRTESNVIILDTQPNLIRLY